MGFTGQNERPDSVSQTLPFGGFTLGEDEFYGASGAVADINVIRSTGFPFDVVATGFSIRTTGNQMVSSHVIFMADEDTDLTPNISVSITNGVNAVFDADGRTSLLVRGTLMTLHMDLTADAGGTNIGAGCMCYERV